MKIFLSNSHIFMNRDQLCESILTVNVMVRNKKYFKGISLHLYYPKDVFIFQNLNYEKHKNKNKTTTVFSRHSKVIVCMNSKQL